MLLILGSGIGYIVYRLTRKPAPTPRAWQAHVTRIAGDGSPTSFSDPFGVAAAQDETIYIADAGDTNQIKKITVEGVVTTLAGGSEGFADGVGPQASFNTPSALAIDGDGKVTAIVVTFRDGTGAPKAEEVFGPNEKIEVKEDGALFHMVRYPDAGYWVSYSSQGSGKPVILMFKKI